MANIELTLANIGRLCVNLQSEDRKTRKSALVSLHKTLFTEGNFDDPVTLSQVFSEHEKSIWKCLYDPAEAVRDASLDIVDELIERLHPSPQLVQELIPILAWRLGDKTVAEPSEEIRLKMMTLLDKLVIKYKNLCTPFMEDMIHIIEKMLVDGYPKVRQQSCSCAANIACQLPREFFSHSNKLVKPILLSFNHQHFRMRVTAIQTLGKVVLHGNTKHLPTDEVFGALAERLFDSSSPVRQSVCRVIGEWLVCLHDRYSFFRKMIPLMLTSLCDELPELRQEAWILWSKAGLQFEEENEQELKEKMDFYSDKPEHYPIHVDRPNLGCRTLVQRNTCQITPALSKELEDWKDDIRIKSAQLLCWLVLHAETDITQHTQGLLLTMCKVCNQTDIRIVENVEKAAEYIAYFVPPDYYMDLIVPTLRDTSTTGHLCVLAALIRGSKPDLLICHIHSLALLLEEDNICRNRDGIYQTRLMDCVDALFEVAGNECSVIAKELFVVAVTVRAVAGQHCIADRTEDALHRLAVFAGHQDKDGLYEKFTPVLLDKMSLSAEGWSAVSYDKFILQLVLQDAGDVLDTHMAFIAGVLKTALHPDGDATVRSNLFVSVASILNNAELIAKRRDQKAYHEFLVSFILDSICPNLVWHAGRTAEAVRTVVVACLCAALEPPSQKGGDATDQLESNVLVVTPHHAQQLLGTLLPLLINSVEDSAVKTRAYSVKALQSLLLLAEKHDLVTPDHINTAYPVLVKRLDDVSDEVRLAALCCLGQIFGHLPASYDVRSFQPHLEALFTTLLIHLDDPDPSFQAIMTDVLKIIGALTPTILTSKLEATKSRFKNEVLCDELLSYLRNCNLADSSDP